MNPINYSFHYSGKFQNSRSNIATIVISDRLSVNILTLLEFFTRVSQLFILSRFLFLFRAYHFSSRHEISIHGDKRMHPRFLVVSMRSLKRISFPSSIARPSEYFKKSFRSCTFNYTVIQMASFTWYFFGRVGRIENSMGVSPFVFIGRGKNLEFTRERVFFIFFPPFFFVSCSCAISLIFSFFFSFSFASSIRLVVRYKVKSVLGTGAIRGQMRRDIS